MIDGGRVGREWPEGCRNKVVWCNHFDCCIFLRFFMPSPRRHLTCRHRFLTKPPTTASTTTTTTTTTATTTTAITPGSIRQSKFYTITLYILFRNSHTTHGAFIIHYIWHYLRFTGSIELNCCISIPSTGMFFAQASCIGFVAHKHTHTCYNHPNPNIF